jgi:hypothetical protein
MKRKVEPEPYVNLDVPLLEARVVQPSQEQGDPVDPRMIRVVSYNHLRSQLLHCTERVRRERADLHREKVRAQRAKLLWVDARARYKGARVDLSRVMEEQRKAKLRLAEYPIDAVVRLRVDVDTGEGWTLPRGPHIIEDADPTEKLVMLRIEGREWWIERRHIAIVRRPWHVSQASRSVDEADEGEGCHIVWGFDQGTTIQAVYADTRRLAIRLTLSEDGRYLIETRDKEGTPIRGREWGGSMRAAVRKGVRRLYRVYGWVREDNAPVFSRQGKASTQKQE